MDQANQRVLKAGQLYMYCLFLEFAQNSSGL